MNGSVEVNTSNGKVDSFDMNAGFFKDTAGNASAFSKNNAYGDVIDLGTDSAGKTFGKLILPITLNSTQVDGGPKTFYYWDWDDDGIPDDGPSHNTLDKIFTKTVTELDGAATPILSPDTTAYTGYTTDTIRFAKINGVAVALPTLDNTLNNSTGYLASNDSNNTRSDLSAIWDAYNGSTMSATLPWYASTGNYAYNNELWSATPTTDLNLHYTLTTNNGRVSNQSDDKTLGTATPTSTSTYWYALFQVM